MNEPADPLREALEYCVEVFAARAGGISYGLAAMKIARAALATKPAETPEPQEDSEWVCPWDICNAEQAQQCRFAEGRTKGTRGCGHYFPPGTTPEQAKRSIAATPNVAIETQAESFSPQEVWELAGGDPCTKVTRADVEHFLHELDAPETQRFRARSARSNEKESTAKRKQGKRST